MIGTPVRRVLFGAILGCVSSAALAAILLASPLAIRGDVIGGLFYAVVYYLWSFIVTVVFGIPAFLLASRFGVANAVSAAAFGGTVGALVGFWLSNGHVDALVAYSAVGVVCGIVFHIVQGRVSRT